MSDPLDQLADENHPSLTMSQAAEILNVQAAFLRSLDAAGVVHPHRSPGGHRRYSRNQLRLAARLRLLLDGGHLLASAEAIVRLEDDLEGARADVRRLRGERDEARRRAR